MSRAKRIALMALSLGASLTAAAPAGAATDGPAEIRPLPTFSQPAVSPDGSQIVFSAGGDLWTVPVTGGTARLLVAHPAHDSRPLWSPDGRFLAFNSARTGNGDVYLFTLATGDVKRLTWDDENELLDSWSRDGRWLYFSSPSHEVGTLHDVFRVRPEGGTPLEVSAERYVNEYFAAPSPDGATLALTARGIVSNQWWRHGSSHIDKSEIWLLRDGVHRRAGAGLDSTQIAREVWPMWSPDGRRLWFMSDRGGAENLWVQEISGAGPGAPSQVTRFTDGRLLWPSVSWDGRTIVFERNLGLWRLDTATGATAEIPVTLEGAPAGPAIVRHDFGDEADELALSPDGKKVAFVAHGEVFAASAQDGGQAARVTHTPDAVEYQVIWEPDSRRLVYVSERDGGKHLWLYDFATREEKRLTSGAGADDTPRFSPDGKLLAFQRDRKELRVLDLGKGAAGRDRRLAEVLLDGPPLGSAQPFEWSPDGKWIAVLAYGERMFRNIQLVPVEGGEPRPASFVANGNADFVEWSPDGTFLLFATNQRSEPGQLARVDLTPRTPRFREDQFRDLFTEEPETESKPTTDGDTAKVVENAEKKPAAKDAKKVKVEPVFEGLRQRLSFLPVGFDVNALALAPDGKSVALIATTGGQSNVWLYSLDELARGPAVSRQLSSTPGPKSALQVSADGKEVWFLDGGSIVAIPIEKGEPRTLTVSAELDVDFGREKVAVFDQAWRYLRDNFVDPGMHGVDWEASRAEYLPRAAGSRTPDELRRLLTLMIGELNASHSGLRTPPAETRRTSGRIGVRFDQEASETSGRLRIREVLPLGPAAVASKPASKPAGRIEPGDWLLAVDGQEVGAETNLEELLDHKIGRQVTLTVADDASGKGKREVAVRPVDQKTEKGLTYRAWVEDNRAYVARVSGGRLGYVHMYDMGDASFAQLLVDLDAENKSREGVVVDMRNNNGGYVNAYALDIISRRGYMGMTYRGFPLAPARSVLGQRALERPTVLVVNRHTLSDGEDFTEGYRTLGLGKVVGEPTAGWIIYTADVDLLDDSQVRLPFIKITDSKGEDMEMAPRPVDLQVDKAVGETLHGRDSQLDEAVRELLRSLPPPAGSGTPRTPR